MKKFYYFVAGLALILVTVIACEQASIEVEELQTIQKEELSAKNDKSQIKVDILHWTGKKWITISVAEAAVDAHMAHGDKFPCFPDFVQDFETNIDGWIEYNGPITFNSGNAIIENGAFTRFDGYRDTWQGTWRAELDVYLDLNWGTSEGFEYSVAANGSDNAHQRDYIFHLNKDASTGNLLVAGSNNTNFAPREDLENINHFVVTTSGWYTLQHVFYENGGFLTVDMNLLDSNGTVLFTETRTGGVDDIMANIGGNRYGWFTLINVPGGITVDNTVLTHCE